MIKGFRFFQAYKYELQWQGAGVQKPWCHVLVKSRNALDGHDLRRVVNTLRDKNNPPIAGSVRFNEVRSLDWEKKLNLDTVRVFDWETNFKTKTK